jgi:glycosyltransferase involved in cell wall biosynthesis
MKVLLVSHTCMTRTVGNLIGQPKLHCLAAHTDVELTALVPHRMRFYGQWSEAEPPENAAFRYVVGKARGQNVLGQWYLQYYPQALGRLLRATRFDVIDLWHEPWSLVCAQTIWLARRYCPQARILVETEQNIYKRLPPPFRQFEQYSLRHADSMVARNQEAVEVLRRKGYAGPAHVVPNAVDSDLFTPWSPEERLKRRIALGWGGTEDFVVGYVGRLVTEKGLMDALEATAQLPAGVRLVFVGNGPLRAELEAQAEARGIKARVHFLGETPPMEMPGVMNALDILILPSRTTPSWKEQFGRVLIEAGACGLAVVGSDSGAIPEVVADAGLIFPEGDAAALATCLNRLRCEPELRARYGQIGRARALSLFSWQCVATQMHSLYQEALGRPGASR